MAIPRRLISLLVLATLVSLPMDAGSRRRSATPSPSPTADALGVGQLTGALLEGTVESVNGAVITLDSGGAAAVRIDAAGGRIISGDQVVQTVADLEPGMRITAFVEAGSPLQAKLIVIESRPPMMVAGEVESINLQEETFTVLGITVATDDATRWDTAFPTFAPMQGLADLQVGDLVKVDASLPGDAILATRVLVVNVDMPQLPVTLRGTVQSMGAREWVLATDEGTTTILIDDRTEIAGEPAAGDEVQVIAERTAGGEYLALVIVRIGPAATQQIEFKGWVNSISSTEWRVGGPPGFPLPTIAVRITPQTTIYASPHVGDMVKVIGTVDEDLTVVATRIERSMGF